MRKPGKNIHLLVLAGCLLASHATAAEAPRSVFNVIEYGAVKDGKSLSTEAFQKAVDACAASGGGTVVVPPGDYLCTAIALKSRVTLWVQGGAIIRVSANPADYLKDARRRLLGAEDAEDIAVIGKGTLHGQATADYGPRWGAPEKPAFRTGILLFERCKNVTIRDVTILYSDSWTLHLKRCDNVLIDGVTIFNNTRRLNSDGIDPNMCRNVRISNCYIVAGDDCIVMKATEEFPCENIVVTNCILETPCTALKLGTESRGDFRDIHVSNCVVRNTRAGIGFYMKDGTTMERVSFSNISMDCFPSAPVEGFHITPIFMDIEKRHADSKIGRIRDVVFRDIFIEAGSGILIQGMPESPIENLTLENISLRVNRADDYAARKKQVGGTRTTKDERDTLFARQPSYATVAHCKGLLVDNLRVLVSNEAFAQFDRSVFSGHNIENAVLRGVYRSAAGKAGGLPVVSLENSRRVLVTGCVVEPGTAEFLGVRGASSAAIALEGNLFEGAPAKIRTEKDVPDGAVRNRDENK